MSRRYRDFVSQIDVDAFEEAIGFEPIKTDENGNDIGHCPDIWGLHKNGDTTGKFAIHREKKVYHCVTGNTLVKTDQGLFSAKELAGSTVNVLTEGGEYQEAAWKSYGQDFIYKVTFDNGDVIEATKDHRWRVSRIKGEPWNKTRRSWVTTKELEGRRVPIQTPNRFDYDSISEYEEGCLHGMTYGDGTLYMDGKYAFLPGYGSEDRNLIRRFCDHVSEHCYAGVEQTRGRKLPGHYKTIPNQESFSTAYLRGFIAGIIAADGHVSKNASPVIHQANFKALEQIRKIAASVGLPASSIKMERKLNPWTGEPAPLYCLTLIRKGFFIDGVLDENLLLKPSHLDNAKTWSSKRRNTHTVKVVSVEDTGRIEEVFCCEEPVTTTWTTGFGYLTGNCWVCGGGSLLSFAMEFKGVGEEEATNWLYQFASEDAISDEGFAEEIERMLAADTELGDSSTFPYFNERVLDGLELAYDWGQEKQIASPVIEHFGIRFDPSRIRSDYQGPAIVFPHHWQGRLVGWQERWLSEDRPQWVPKYTNTSDFPKEFTLYNYDWTMFGQEVVVVESVPTVLVLASIGIPAMATFGSSVTSEQMRLMRRCTEGIIIAPDNDDPGIKFIESLYEGLDRYIPLKVIEPVGKEDTGDDLGDLESSDEILEAVRAAQFIN